MVMVDALFISVLENLGLNARIGIWIVLILTAFYIWRTMQVGSKVSNWMIILAAALVVIGLGLALGVIEGINVDRFFGLVQALFDFAWSIIQRAIEFI